MKWYFQAERLGPDIPITHVLLYSTRLGNWICRKKFAHFGAGAEFRPHAIAICTRKISIGARVVIRPGTELRAEDSEGGQITIQDDVLIGPKVVFIVARHAFSNSTVPIIDQGFEKACPIVVEQGAWIGAGAIILPGVTIGANAVVGAGAIVTKDVKSRTVVAGNPARMIREI